MTAQSSDPNWQPQQQPGAPVKQKRRFTAGQVIGVLIVIVLIVFIAENTTKVDVRLIGPEVHVPLFVALIIAAVLGGLVTLLITYRRSRRKGERKIS
jgi:uncharacterized integral membrane protein